MKVSIEGRPDKEWNSFVYKHPFGSIYHTSYWMNVIEQSFSHITGQIIVVRNSQNEIVAGLPVYLVDSWLTGRRLVSAPFALYCGPLITSFTEVEQLFVFLKKLHNQLLTNFIELRLDPQIILQKNDFGIDQSNKVHVLSLDSSKDDIQKRFSKNIKYSIRKAYKNNLNIKEGKTEKELRNFFMILAQNRQYLGLPIIPYKFFQSLWNILRPKGYLKLFLVQKDNIIIGGELFLTYKETIFLEYQASIISLRQLHTNQFLQWEAIKFGLRNNYKYYNLGRTDTKNKGLLFYKSRWGTKEFDLPKMYYPATFRTIEEQRTNSIKYKIAKQIFKHSPIFLSYFLGKMLYKHMG